MQFVAFEWDDARKAGLNFRKHGVRLPEAIPVFDDPHAITVPDDESDPNELRFVTLGIGAAGRLLAVVYTCRNEIYESFPRGSPNRMSAKNTRYNYERSLRLP